MPTLFSSSNMQLPFLRPEPNPSAPSRGRTVNIRGQVSSLFTGRSVIQPRSSSDATPPKSPGPRLGLQVLSPERDNLPTLDTSTHPLRRSPSSTCSMIDSASSPVNTIRPLTPSTFERLERSANANRPRPPPRARTFTQPRSSRGGTSPEELVLVNFMDNQRRRNSTPKKTSKITLRRFTLANIKNPKARGKAISCMVSGGLLAVILAIYLALAVSNPVAGQEFHVLLILIILMMTIFFVHSLIRLCMLVLRPERQQQTSGRVAGRMGTAGYAQPDRPIQITLARDEEIAIDEEEESGKPVLPPPPAYGLWRSSVRMNPNMVYWQKIESSHRHNRHSAIPEGDLESEPVAANRPPSYVSEDGVEYVIEAQPRPTVYESLPLHPSERGRLRTVPAR